MSRPTDMCPNCGRRDAHVYRVSGLLHAGPRESDILSEKLRKELSMVPEPQRGLLFDLAWQLILLMLVLGFGLWQLNDRIWTLIPGGVGLGAIGLFYWRWHVQQRALVHWKRKKTKWEELYYCFYDDRVFLAGSPHSVPPYRMPELIS